MPALAQEGASQRSFRRRGGENHVVTAWECGAEAEGMGLLRVTRYIAKLNAIFER